MTMRDRYLAWSHRLFLAVWPAIFAVVIAFLTWVVKSQAAQDERLLKLEMFGPLAGERFTHKDAAGLQGAILAEVAARQSTRDAALSAKLETIQHSVIRMEVQMSTVLAEQEVKK